MADKIKLGLALLLVAGGVVGFYYLGESPLVLRVAAIIVGLAAAAAVASTSEPGKQFYIFAQESVAETKKVVWPSRKETVQSTGVVLAFVIVMAGFLWLVDAMLVWAVKILLGPEV